MLILYSGLFKRLSNEEPDPTNDVTCSNLDLFDCINDKTWIAYVGSRRTVTPDRGLTCSIFTPRAHHKGVRNTMNRAIIVPKISVIVLQVVS